MESNIPADHLWELIPPFGIVNHAYVANYNEKVAELITQILGKQGL